MSITPKNWASFQHYKDRDPVWIKLHKALLDNYEFHCLPVASKALAPMLWLLASCYQDGRITLTITAMAFRLHYSEPEFVEGLKPLIDSGFFIDDSNTLADCYQVASPEREREKEEIEKERKENASRKRKPKRPKTTLPETWHPIIAIEDAPEFDRFTDYCKANGRTYADWDAAWRNWKTSPYRNKGNGNGRPRPGSREYRQEENWNVMETLKNYRDPISADDQGGSNSEDSSLFGALPVVKPSRS